MKEEKLCRILPLMFREVKVPKRAKEELRQRLFEDNTLSDDDLTLVSAAGDLVEQAQRNKEKQEG